MLDHDDAGAVELARSARLQLWIALVAALIVPFTAFGHNTTVFAIFWVISFLAGASGIRDASRATGGNAMVMYLAIVAVFMPLANLLAIGAYLATISAALKGGSTPPARSAPSTRPMRTPQAAAKAPPRMAQPAARPAAAQGTIPPGALADHGPTTRNDLVRSIASVKMALFPDDGREIPDGTVLEARVAPGATPAGMQVAPVMRATGGRFAVCYLVDRGDHFVWVNKADLEASGLTRDQLHTAGLFNLGAALSAKPGLRMLPQGSFNGLVMGGDHEASLVLLDELWDDTLKGHYNGAPVVAIPVKDICAFCDEDSAEGIQQLRTILERHVKAGDKIICDRLLVRREGRWLELAPEKKTDLPPLEFKM